jgi:hypothetical protein
MCCSSAQEITHPDWRSVASLCGSLFRSQALWVIQSREVGTVAVLKKGIRIKPHRRAHIGSPLLDSRFS